MNFITKSLIATSFLLGLTVASARVVVPIGTPVVQVNSSVNVGYPYGASYCEYNYCSRSGVSIGFGPIILGDYYYPHYYSHYPRHYRHMPPPPPHHYGYYRGYDHPRWNPGHGHGRGFGPHHGPRHGSFHHGRGRH